MTPRPHERPPQLSSRRSRRSSRACSAVPSGRTSSRSSWRASSRRRWTTTARSRSRASTSRTSTRSTSRRPTASSSRATRSSLVGELQEYLAEHARRESYALLSPPNVLMRDRRRPRRRRVRDRDADGAARGRARRRSRTRPAPQVEPGATMIYKADARRSRPRPPRRPSSGSSRRSSSLDAERAHATRSTQAPTRARPLEGLRHPARRPERLAPPRRAAPGGHDVLDRRPRLDERHRGERQARASARSSTTATRSRSARPSSSSAGRPRDARDSIAVDEALLVLKIAFLVLLYLFIWRIVRTASRDLRLPQESFILAPAARRASGSALAPADRAGAARRRSRARRSTRASDVRARLGPLTIGRGGQNDIPLDGDEFASAQHARFEPRRDGVWVEDVGSTNGTFVNGARIDAPAAARAGRRRPRRRDRLLRFER